MCVTVIPGQFKEILATRNVQKPTRRKQAFKKVVAPKKAAPIVLPNGTPCFCGGTLVKTVLTWDQCDSKWSRQARNVRAQNAKKHSRLVRPSRESHRQINRLRAF